MWDVFTAAMCTGVTVHGAAVPRGVSGHSALEKIDFRSGIYYYKE